MKGTAYTLLFTAVAAIVVTLAFVVGTAFLMAGLVDTEVEQKTTLSALKASDAAHLARKCLARNGYVDMDYLKSLKDGGKALKEECGFSWDFGILIRDWEAPGSDPFDYGYAAGLTRSMTAVLKVGDELHLGEMRVSI